MSLGISAAAWAGIGAVGSVAVGAIAAGNAGDAANAQADATNHASDATLQAQREAIAAQQPFLDAGYASVNKLQELLGIGPNTGAAGYGSLNKPFTPGDLTQDPGYQFQQQQGQNVLDRKAAAGGGFYSGQALEGAAAFNQGLAGTTYNDAFNRHQVERSNVLNPLQAMAGQGQTSANATGQIGMSGANSLANLWTNNANAQGAAGIAGANALLTGVNNGMTAWQRAQYLQQPGTQPMYGAPSYGAGGWSPGRGDGFYTDPFMGP